MLNATTAFDRVEYCKLFKLLIERSFQPVIITFLLNIYSGHVVRISWNDVYRNLDSPRSGSRQTKKIKKYTTNTRVNINSIDKISNNNNYYYYMLVSTFDGFNLETRQKLLYKLYCSTRYISN